MPAWIVVKKLFLMYQHLTCLGRQNTCSLSVNTESNSVSRDRGCEPEEVCSIYLVHTCFTEKQQGAASNCLPPGTDGLWYVSHCSCTGTGLLHGVGALDASKCWSGSTAWAALCLFSHYLHNGFLFMGLLEVGWFSVWAVAVCTQKPLFKCTKDIFDICFLSFFNSKLCSVYSLSSRQKAVVMPCPFDGLKYGVTRSEQSMNDGWAETCPRGPAGRACPRATQEQGSWWASGTAPPPGMEHLLWDRDRPPQARGRPTGALSSSGPVARLGTAEWSWRPAAGTDSPGRGTRGPWGEGGRRGGGVLGRDREAFGCHHRWQSSANKSIYSNTERAKPGSECFVAAHLGWSLKVQLSPRISPACTRLSLGSSAHSGWVVLADCK